MSVNVSGLEQSKTAKQQTWQNVGVASQNQPRGCSVRPDEIQPFKAVEPLQSFTIKGLNPFALSLTTKCIPQTVMSDHLSKTADVAIWSCNVGIIVEPSLAVEKQLRPSFQKQ